MSARKFQTSPGPGWAEELWELRFAELTEFQRAHGHTLVPSRLPRNPPLGRWVAHQRVLYRLGELRADRMHRLKKLGFQWLSLKPHHDERNRYLRKMLARLVAYRKRHGHAGVSIARDAALGRWIMRQRQYRRIGMLKKARIERMDAAGFPWVEVNYLWEEQFARLRKFKARFGHTRMPARWKENVALGRWVAHQRQYHRRGTLDPERRRRLNEIGFQWKVPHSGGMKGRL